MDFLKRLWIAIKNKRNLICIITIAVCLIVCIITFAIKLKNGYTYNIGEFDTPEMFSEDTTMAQFGTKTLTKAEYSFVYYSILYSSFPSLKSYSYDDLNNYIINKQYGTDDDGNPISIAQALQSETEEAITEMLSYVQDVEDNEIELDVSSKVEEYRQTLADSAEASGSSDLDSYLSAYYGEGTTESDLNDIINSYAIYKEYSENYLLNDILDISDKEYEEYYQKTKDVIDNFYIDYIFYFITSDDEGTKNLSDDDDAKLKKVIEDGYENIHKRDDMIEFAETLNEKYSEEVENSVIITDTSGESIDGYWLYLISSDVYSWAISDDIEQDAAAIFKEDEYYAIAYFNKREKPTEDAVTGIIVSPYRTFETTDEGYAIGATIYDDKEESPYYKVANIIKDKIDASERSLNYDLINTIINEVDTSIYDEPISITLSNIQMSPPSNFIADTDAQEKVAEASVGQAVLVEETSNGYFNIFYKTSENIPYYKGQIALSLYDEKCDTIEETYQDMFSNITYLTD